MKLSFDERRMMSVVVERLAGRFPQLPTSVVAEVVEAAYGGFSTSPVREFVPMLVEKHAAEELTARARGLADA